MNTSELVSPKPCITVPETTASDSLFEIHDGATYFRAACAGATGIVGIGVLAVAFKISEDVAAWQTRDVTVLSVGLVFLLLGAVWWLFLPPRRQLLLKATPDGLYVRETGLPAHLSGYVFTPWKAVGKFSLGHEECWCLSVAINLPEQDRIRLRNRHGGYSRDSSGFVALTVAVLHKRHGTTAIGVLEELQKQFVR